MTDEEVLVELLKKFRKDDWNYVALSEGNYLVLDGRMDLEPHEVEVWKRVIQDA